MIYCWLLSPFRYYTNTMIVVTDLTVVGENRKSMYMQCKRNYALYTYREMSDILIYQLFINFSLFSYFSWTPLYKKTIKVHKIEGLFLHLNSGIKSYNKY